ncbi:MAG TPA: hypothetical protein VN723_06120 [Rhizomicrobium sp.]|nr:hypothetical protein [Rhizomicrobium sp.]
MPSRFLNFVPILAIAWAFALLLARPALAEDLYTVSGVHVDASAASSAEALNVAIAQGRPRAWQILYRRLTRQQDWARQPQLDAAALVRLSRGYTPASERRSTTRYVADVTYMFNPDAVARTLRDANIAFTQTVVRRILLVPMSPGYNNGSWTQAFTSPSLRDSLVPFALPTAADASDLAGLNFDSANWNDVAAVADRIKATEAALLQVVNVNGKVMVNVRRLGQGEAPAQTQVEVPLMQSFNATFPAAAQAGLTAMEDLWKSRSVVNYNTRGTLTADVKLDSLNQWGAVQSALSGTGTVTNVQVVAMNTGYARLSITYLGTLDQLRDALNEGGLALSNKSGQFILTPGARLNGGGGR